MNIGNGKWHALLQVLLLGGCASLAGCGNSDSPPVAPPIFNNPNATITIETFGVAGNSPITNQVVQISPRSIANPNGGLFTVSWTVRGNDTYTARMYVSSDNVRDSTDIRIHEGCGKITVTDACRSNALPACIFESTSTNTISCVTPSGSPIVDVSTVIPVRTPRVQVPAFIIMEACNPNGTCFPTVATAVPSVRVNFH